MADKIKSYFKEDKQSEQIIESFIKTNIGTITIGKDSKEIIQKLIKEFNQIEDYEKFGEK